MLHLERAILQFNDSSDPRTTSEIELDRDVVSIMHDKDLPHRAQVLRAWLEQYSVLVGFGETVRNEICRTALAFADLEDRSAGFRDRQHLLQVFHALEDQLNRVLCRQGRKQRDLTPLCSKLLWCMYPEQMPIYNANVRAALATLSRLMDLPDMHETTEFTCFLETWYRVFQRVAPLLRGGDEALRSVSRARYFDRLLWFLGNPLLPCGGSHQLTHLRTTVN